MSDGIVTAEEIRTLDLSKAAKVRPSLFKEDLVEERLADLEKTVFFLVKEVKSLRGLVFMSMKKKKHV